MPVSKIKNLILLILLLSVVCLLVQIVPARLEQVRAEEALHQQLEELFASYDIRLNGAALPRSVSLYAIELGAQREDAAVAAQALLGADAVLMPDSTHYASTYSAAAGRCAFRADGTFTATLSGAQSTQEPADAAKKLLRKMGFAAQDVSEPQRVSAGVYEVAAGQNILGVPVLSEGLRLTYTNGSLSGIEGTFFTGASQVARTSENACISCADALVALLSGREALGWVGSEITSVRQCYRHTESASASVRLTPVWVIETDTGSFCVNGLTREISTLEGAHGEAN